MLGVGRRGWWVVGAVVALVAVLVGGVLGYRLLVKVPRPSLAYPSGQSLDAVRGNCDKGSELLGCDAGKGPRSFLTVKVASGSPRTAVEELFTALARDGWRKEEAGRTARDFAGGGEPEDLQPVYCRNGCVGLFRFESDAYVLAWFAS